MEPETTKLIEELVKMLAMNSVYATEQYTAWYLTSAFCWVTFGATACIAAIKFPVLENWDALPSQIVRIILFIVGALILAMNIPDLLNPQAVAIHQLIYDIKH